MGSSNKVHLVSRHGPVKALKFGAQGASSSNMY